MTLGLTIILSLYYQMAFATIMDANWVLKDHEKRTGVLEYLDQGASPVKEMRRRDALAKMEEFCHPNKYKLLTETAGTKQYGDDHRPAKTFGAIVSKGKSLEIVFSQTEGNNSFPVLVNYNYLAFKCIE